MLTYTLVSVVRYKGMCGNDAQGVNIVHCVCQCHVSCAYGMIAMKSSKLKILD